MLRRDPHSDKHVTLTLQTTYANRKAEAVLTRYNAHHLNFGGDLYSDGPEKNAPQVTPHLEQHGTRPKFLTQGHYITQYRLRELRHAGGV